MNIDDNHVGRVVMVYRELDQYSSEAVCLTSTRYGRALDLSLSLKRKESFLSPRLPDCVGVCLFVSVFACVILRFVRVCVCVCVFCLASLPENVITVTHLSGFSPSQTVKYVLLHSYPFPSSFPMQGGQSHPSCQTPSTVNN